MHIVDISYLLAINRYNYFKTEIISLRHDIITNLAIKYLRAENITNRRYLKLLIRDLEICTTQRVIFEAKEPPFKRNHCSTRDL